MATLIDKLTNMRPSTAIAAAVLLLAGICYADYVTGYDVQFGPFYLLPICLVAWRMGRGPGMVAAAASVAANVGSDIAAGIPSERIYVALWNAAGTTVFYGFCVAMLVALRERLAAESHRARIDHLTGIANPQGFFEVARRELARCKRFARPFTVAVIDCDHFKELNDSLGHRAGDDCLRTIGRTLAAETRATDIVARLGGDEFVLVMPEAGETPGRCALERVRERLLAEMVRCDWPITFTIGAVTAVDPAGEIEDLIHAADQTLYSAKRSGKNRLRQISWPEADPAAAVAA